MPSRPARLALVLGGATLLALALTWPLAAHFGSALPLGTEEVATVPLFNLWTLGWNADRAAALYRGYWDAPIFHPERGAFAFSEPQPATGLAAALLWRLLPPVAVYNALLLASLAANGVAGWALARRLGLGTSPALAAGAMVESLPFVQQELGVLQLVALWGPCWALGAVVALMQSPAMRRAVELGVAVALTWLTCAYYGLFLLALAPAMAVGWLTAAWRDSRWWRAVALAAVVAALLVGPFAMAQRRALSREGFERAPESVRRHSASPGDYLEAAWRPLVPLPAVGTALEPDDHAFWPGAVKVALAAVGLSGLATRSPRRRAAISLAALAGVAFVLSLGPWASEATSANALARLPGLAQVRSPFRAAALVQLAVALLAAAGLAHLLERWPGRRWCASLAIGLTLLALLEVRPPVQPLAPLPALDLDLAWLEWVERETAADDVLALLPFPEGRSVADYLGTTQWMYWQLRHRRPMVNGYSGFFPPSFKELKATMATFPADAALAALAARGVDWILVHRQFYPPAALEGAVGLELAFSDPAAGIDAYDLIAEDPSTLRLTPGPSAAAGRWR